MGIKEDLSSIDQGMRMSRTVGVANMQLAIQHLVGGQNSCFYILYSQNSNPKF